MGFVLAITGGTGSFGQACVKYIKENTPDWFDKIIIYSRDEQKQEKMERHFNWNKLRFFIGDVRDAERTKLALREATHILHAAALKIVPAGEYNPFEFVKTNILGTQNVLEAIGDYSSHSYLSSGYVRKFIMLSTDKAVQPINLYGATKLAAEKLTIAYNNVHGPTGPVCSVVRYGNVAGSNGSVIPVFAEKIKKGEQITITDKNMTRYWITLEQAVKFTLQRFNDPPKTYYPIMPSFRVTDLALAFDAGPYVETGIRPGEKLHETIDGIRHSCDNDTWLSVAELRQQLLQMGYIQDGA